MDVLDATDYLLVHLGSFVLFEPSVLNDMLEEFAPRAVLHDEVEVVVVLDHLIQLDYLWMPHFLEDRNFPVDAFNVRMVLDFVLLKNFDGYLVTSQNMSSLLDLPKSALSLGLTDDKATNDFALRVLLFLHLAVSQRIWYLVLNNISQNHE